MSGWTIITLRGKPSKDYPYSEYNENDPGQVLRNAVHPDIGKQILKSRNKKQATLNSL